MNSVNGKQRARVRKRGLKESAEYVTVAFKLSPYLQTTNKKLRLCCFFCRFCKSVSCFIYFALVIICPLYYKFIYFVSNKVRSSREKVIMTLIY